MKKYPFQKLLIYLLVREKYDKRKFGKLLDEYLPSLTLDHKTVFNFIYSLIENSSVPKSIISGDYNSDAFNIFLKQQKLVNLHAAIDQPGFQEIIFDTDITRKINGMALSPVFKLIDIYHEFNTYNNIFIDTYLDCFAAYDELESKQNFIRTYVTDKNERNLFLRICENSSRQYLKLILCIKIQDASPMELINDALNICKLKAQTALLAEDDAELERWLKLQVVIAEKLHKAGAGNKSDLDDLIEKLKAVPEYQDPVIYTKEQLEEKFISNQSL